MVGFGYLAVEVEAQAGAVGLFGYKWLEQAIGYVLIYSTVGRVIVARLSESSFHDSESRATEIASCVKL